MLGELLLRRDRCRGAEAGEGNVRVTAATPWVDAEGAVFGSEEEFGVDELLHSGAGRHQGRFEVPGDATVGERIRQRLSGDDVCLDVFLNLFGEGHEELG